MICVFYDRDNMINENEAYTTLIHYMPDDPVEGLPEEIKAQGIMVENIPAPERIEDKYPKLIINITTKTFRYEYVDIPKTKEEIVQEQIQDLQIAMANIMGAGV